MITAACCIMGATCSSMMKTWTCPCSARKVCARACVSCVCVCVCAIVCVRARVCVYVCLCLCAYLAVAGPACTTLPERLFLETGDSAIIVHLTHKNWPHYSVINARSRLFHKRIHTTLRYTRMRGSFMHTYT
jgi:hypothetical protein